MERGWDATGLLAPLWSRVGGRDALARLSGIQPGTLSGYNTGRLRLGWPNAVKIADALTAHLGREVSILELGAPQDSPERPASVLDRLAALEATVDRGGQDVTRVLAELAKAVRALERQLARAERPANGNAA